MWNYTGKNYTTRNYMVKCKITRVNKHKKIKITGNVKYRERRKFSENVKLQGRNVKL